MILGRKYIKLFMRLGWIHCDPPPVKITENSLDITLGNHFWTIGDVDSVYMGDDSRGRFNYTTAKYIEIQPSQMVIGCTEEFVGSTVPFVVPQVVSKSSTARWGLEAITGAGFGEGGFHSRWALEIVNTNSVPVVVLAGTPIGQMYFTLCIGGGLYKRSYNQPRDKWSPEVLLPKSVVPFDIEV